MAPKLLSLDTGYSLALIRARRLESVFRSRDLDGFFEHVWDVHPIVGASPEHDPSTAVGRPAAAPLIPGHTMVEGRVGRFAALSRVPLLNLALAQAQLLVHLLRLIRRERVSLVNANDPLYTGLLGLALARANRIPLMITVVANHDIAYAEQGLLAYPRLFRRRSIEKKVERFVFSRADLVAVGSEDNRGFAVSNGARPERIAFFRYGDLVDPVHWVDPAERPSVRDELGLGDRPFLITVSRFEPIKHTADTLTVLAAARGRVPALAAVVVGDGVLRPRLEAQARQLGIEDAVVFAGIRDQAWIARALSSADVVVSAVTGRALVEASLSGTPIVAYDFEWQSEFVLDGETGFVVPHRDTDAMAAAACRLLEDPALAARLAAAARARTSELWDPAANRAERRARLAELIGVPAGDPVR
ncbi:MAG: glycosyltransferase [Acidimicrobiales bacterium]